MKFKSLDVQSLWRAVSRSARKELGARSVCEIPWYEQYETGYHCLASTLGRAYRKPAQGELECIRELIARRANPTGSLTVADCLFLTAFVSIVRPDRIMEIGTGSGFSSALLACAIHLQRRDSFAFSVDTLDAHATYFADPQLPIGFEISNLIPVFAQSVRIHAPRESNFVASLAEKDELELAFIDGNHQHPCPLLDVLRIAPYVRGGGWVLLHDIRLGSLVEASRRRGVSLAYEALFGAEWLFDEWPWDKIDAGNIGAIQLPADKKALLRPTRKLLNLPFEVCERSYPRMRKEISDAARVCAQ